MANHLTQSARSTDQALARAGFPTYRQFLTRARNVYDPVLAARLRRAQLPPNHPFIPAFANALNMSERRFAAIFSAKGKMLPERVRKTIAIRFAANGGPSRPAGATRTLKAPSSESESMTATDLGREAATHTNGNTNGNGSERPSKYAAKLDPSRVDHAIMLQAGLFTSGSVMKASGHVSSALAKLLTDRALPPNHPFIPDIARALKISEKDFIDAFSAHGKPMSDAQAARLARQYGNGHRAPVLARGRPRGVKTNQLKRQALDLRQATRSIVSTVNLAAMAGESSVTIPLDALYLFLTDYIERAHIKGAVLVSPTFAEQFG